MRHVARFLVLLFIWPAAALADVSPRLELPDFSTLSQKASESVVISLDPTLLAMAGRFLDDKNPQDAAALEAIKGLKGIYVRSYTFDKEFVYQESDMAAVTKQLTGPGWTRLVQTRSRNRENVDIYVMVADGKAIGLALISREPRAFTIVNIIGSIDLDKLHTLGGHFGVPNFDVDHPKGSR